MNEAHELLRLAKELVSAAMGLYVDSVIDGVNVTQVDVDGRSSASIRGNKLLIKWGPDAPVGSYTRDHYLPKWVRWAKRKLEKKSERVEQKKEWERTIVNGYSVYNLDGKEEVARHMAQIERDVQPIVQHFGLRYNALKESVAEGSLGFNRGGGSVIPLNLRQKANPMLLRKYSAVMATMIHELAHVRHMNHGSQFQALEIEIMQWARDKGIYKPF
jgi:hypothetical protein